MRELSGADMRREYNLVMEALTEKFVAGDDPSVVVGDFLEKASMCLSSIRESYNRKAGDREQTIQPVLSEVSKLSGYIEELVSDLKQHMASGSPEDNNKSVED